MQNTIAPHELVPASRFQRHPHNRHPHPEAVDQLAESVRQVGILQPITARPIEDPESGETLFQIVMGECRWRACQQIDPEHDVPAFIRHDLDEKQTAKLLAVENFQRKELDKIQEAQALQHMRDSGWTIDEISASVGVSVKGIYRALNLLKLPESAREAVREGYLSTHVTDVIAQLPEDQWEAAVRDCVEPTHRTTSLAKDEALQHVRTHYAEPNKRRATWAARRHELENEWPDAEWCDYDEALDMAGYSSGFVPAFEKPESYQIRRDLAVADAPTWLELAKTHGAKRYIGIPPGGDPAEATLYVEEDPIKDAEISAHRDSPETCTFHVPSRDQETRLTDEEREAREKKAAEDAAREAKLVEDLRKDRTKLIDKIFAGGLNKTATTRLAKQALREMFDRELLFPDTLHVLYAVPARLEEGSDEEAEFFIDRLQKDLAKNDAPALEQLGRILLAYMVAEAGATLAYPHLRSSFASFVFGDGDKPIVKTSDYPAIASCRAGAEPTGEEAADA